MSNHLEPWSISADNFPADSYASDQLEFLLGYAVLAPSTHNSQPWLFRINAMDVEIFANTHRALPVVDPQGRELVISCGAALFNLRVATEYFGHVYQAIAFPDPANPNLLVRLQLGLQGETSSEDIVLFQALIQRRTNRTAFRPEPVPAEIVSALAACAASEGCWLAILEAEGSRTSLADLVAEADRVQWQDRRFRQELAGWVRPKPEAHPDGLPAHTLGVKDWLSFAGPSLIRTFDRGGGQAARDREIALHSPLLAVLGTETDDARAWLSAGQALESVLLRASAEGIASSFLCQPVEVPSLREQVASLCSRTGCPQTVLRFGYGDPVPPTPRWGVRELLIRHETTHP